jgi:hypothetical protein
LVALATAIDNLAPLEKSSRALAFAQPDPGPVYTINGWPTGPATIPCDAFEKSANGYWVLIGTIIVQP